MSENFIQKYLRFIEKHVEKLIKIELIKTSNHNLIVVINISIEFRIIITILQKIIFFAQKRGFYVVRSTLIKRKKFEITIISADSVN